jgi:hypothetical protein
MTRVHPNATPALRDLCKAFKYRRKTVFLVDSEKATLSGGYWSGGSRAQYGLYTLPAGRVSPLAYPTAPPQHGGAPAPSVAIEPGSYVVAGGTSNGKQAILTVYGPDAVEKFGG